MKTCITAVKAFAADERGVTAIEYGLIAALMAAAVGTAFALLGPALKTAFTTIASTITAA